MNTLQAELTEGSGISSSLLVELSAFFETCTGPHAFLQAEITWQFCTWIMPTTRKFYLFLSALAQGGQVKVVVLPKAIINAKTCQLYVFMHSPFKQSLLASFTTFYVGRCDYV
jgi:hypothetical protein